MITSPLDTNNVNETNSEMQHKKAKKSLNKEDFMRLLITQLQFQSPLDPMKHTEFISQMAQFTSLDQLFNISKDLNNLSDIQNIMDRIQSLNIIGKQVTVSGNRIFISKDNKDASIGYTLDRDVKGLLIYVKDKEGNIIRTMKTGSQDAGFHSIRWDGKDENGIPVKEGEYIVSIRTDDESNTKIPTIVHGIVKGTKFEDGRPYVLLGHLSIPLTDIIEVKEVK